ncbi:hypothetical protein FJQ87_06940 [Shewanella sp. SNU WT4]|uniref:hypothetical protein n=1 Tax=Shewanella sp. SNU WT4 TaxID=2590015 RepID=UPI00112DC525|nr:hypothetical protein [Shewanella sp. SNU WT4]QDF66471.1 hypothetical protein FJQ87_06940 [Shewanella sp. SNU WT4]
MFRLQSSTLSFSLRLLAASIGSYGCTLAICAALHQVLTLAPLDKVYLVTMLAFVIFILLSLLSLCLRSLPKVLGLLTGLSLLSLATVRCLAPFEAMPL